MLAACTNQQSEGGSPVGSQTYEITFAGQVGTVLRAEFDDCEVTVGLRGHDFWAELPDPQPSLGSCSGSPARSKFVHVHLVAPPPEL